MESQETRIYRAFCELADSGVRANPEKWVIGVSLDGFRELVGNTPDVIGLKFHTHSRSYRVVPIDGLEDGQTAMIYGWQ